MRRRVKVAAAAVVALLLMLPGLALGGTARLVTADLPSDIAHLEVRISTTSDFTVLSFSPGTIAAARFEHRRGTGVWSAGGSQISLGKARPFHTSSVIAQVLFVETSQSPIQVSLNKGNDGSTRTSIAITSGAADSQVERLLDRRHSASGSANTVSRTLTRSAVMGEASTALPRKDPRRLVLAFYYPWYRKGYDDSRFEERPEDPRSTFSRSGVESMTAQAKANGVDGFVVSWSGAAADAKQFRLADEAAVAQHQVITGYLETKLAAGHVPILADRQTGLAWLVQLLKFRNSPAFLKTRGGTPVVFVYSMASYTPTEWRWILGRLHSRYHQHVALVGDDPASAYLPLEWGVHAYSATQSIAALRSRALDTNLSVKEQAALFPGSPDKLYAATVSPGFDSSRESGNEYPVVPRAGGRRYVATWRAAESGQPDWILITSWNEWFEDTAIEPGTRSGSRALALTKQESAAWKAQG